MAELAWKGESIEYQAAFFDDCTAHQTEELAASRNAHEEAAAKVGMDRERTKQSVNYKHPRDLIIQR